MLATQDGRIIATENGRFVEPKIDTLTYMMSGDQFPLPVLYPGEGNMYFESTEPQQVTVSYSDGNSDVYDFGQDGSTWKIGWNDQDTPSSRIPSNCLKPKHVYTDNSTAQRKVSFQFEKPLKIITVYSGGVGIEGAYPKDIGGFVNLKEFTCEWARYIQSIPVSLSKCKNIESLTFSNSTPNILNQIPDSFFGLENLKEFNARQSFDLSDPISSNFFKINQLLNLEKLDFRKCNIYELPQEIAQLTELKSLLLNTNKLQQYPPVLAGLDKMNFLYLGFDPDMTQQLEWGDLSNMKELNNFWPIYDNFNLQAIPQDWTPLVSLKNVGGSAFNQFITINQRFDEFIDVLYQLVTQNAYLDPNSAPPSENHPDKFRDIKWGDGSLSQTGTVQAPTGFTQGTNNGTPANQGEKIYVLANNYGHTITYA